MKHMNLMNLRGTFVFERLVKVCSNRCLEVPHQKSFLEFRMHVQLQRREVCWKFVSTRAAFGNKHCI